MIELALALIILFLMIVALVVLLIKTFNELEIENDKARYWEWKYYCMEDDYDYLKMKESRRIVPIYSRVSGTLTYEDGKCSIGIDQERKNDTFIVAEYLGDGKFRRVIE